MNKKETMNKKSPLTYILLTLPFMLWAALEVYPSFDDWSTLSSPNTDREWLKFFMPYGSVWRPFDALFGYITGVWPGWFPALNHVCIVFGHTVSALLLYDIMRRFGLNRAARFVATLFFWLSPCMLGTVLSCDALNQTYSQVWGLGAVWCYIAMRGRKRYAAWAVCVMMAALAKDNGIAWAVVPPMVAYAFDRCDRRMLVRGIVFGLSVAVVYAVVRISLPKTDIYNPDYSTFILAKKIKEIAVWVGYTWVAADYVSIVHAPSRNLLVFAATLVLSLPMVYIVFVRNFRHLFTRRCAGVIAAMITVMSPHLLISLSVMNTYAGLGMAALLVATVIDKTYPADRHLIMISFAMYLVAALITDIHHTCKAISTSTVGRDMAREAIRATGGEVKTVRCVIVDDDEKKFSSFCVLPQDAFGGSGAAVMHETQYRWPKTVNDTIIPRSQADKAETMAREALMSNQYDCAWIIDKDKVRVIR